MQHTLRFPAVLCATLLALTGLTANSRAQTAPESGSAASRAAALTRYYTQQLQLRPHQYRPVYHAALAEVHSLDSLQALGSSSPAALARVETRFAHQLEPMLSGAQRSTLAGLHAPASVTPAPLTAARHR